MSTGQNSEGDRFWENLEPAETSNCAKSDDLDPNDVTSSTQKDSVQVCKVWIPFCSPSWKFYWLKSHLTLNLFSHSKSLLEPHQTDESERPTDCWERCQSLANQKRCSNAGGLIVWPTTDRPDSSGSVMVDEELDNNRSSQGSGARRSEPVVYQPFEPAIRWMLLLNNEFTMNSSIQ